MHIAVAADCVRWGPVSVEAAHSQIRKWIENDNNRFQNVTAANASFG